MCFDPDLYPKNSPKWPKTVQKRPKMWQNQKHKDRAVLPKPKLTVYIRRSPKKFLSLTPTPKPAPKGSKKCQKGPNCGQIKHKKMGLYFHTINHASQVFFKFSFLGFVHAPVMCIL